MTLLFADSFDHYATLDQKGWQNNPYYAQLGAGGRNGTSCMIVSNRAGGLYPLPSLPASVVVGVAIRTTGIQNEILFGLQDTGTWQLEVRMTNLGALVLTRNGTVLAQTANGVLVVGASNYYELKATIAPGAGGSATVRLNSAAILTVAGVNTRATGVSQVTGVMFGDFATLTTCYVDDVYICDQLGARNNDFLGDVRVQAILPNGAGNYTEWDGLTGAATHWQAQADNPPDGDTSYVSDTLGTPGHRDTYALGNVTPTAGTVPAVQVSAWARKDDAGARSIATMLRGGAGPVDAVGATVALGGAYLYTTQVYELDPAGGSWTIANVNGLEAGVKAVS